MRIGYACQTLAVRDTDFKSCVMKNASEDRLYEVTAHNLKILERIIDYNIRERIPMFRISSDLIPFGSSPVNTLPWWELFQKEFQALGEKIREADIRVSMHPGQYTVLNSPDQDVVKRAIVDLEYHNLVLDLLGTARSSKLILHIGGAYGDKFLAARRFLDSYRTLDSGIRDRLIIENDDKIYNAAEVYQIAEAGGIPFVFDVLHHAVNLEPDGADAYTWIERARATWMEGDGNQKIHYSEQNPDKKAGSHSETIGAKSFMEFYAGLGSHKPDMMLEVKDKNISAVKCRDLTNQRGRITDLEREWGRYKYLVLQQDQNAYKAIRNLLKDKQSYPVEAFYQLVEDAVYATGSVGSAINAAEHVWGYFKDQAKNSEKQKFARDIRAYADGRLSLRALKRFLEKMAVQYEEPYLSDTYYFMDTE